MWEYSDNEFIKIFRKMLTWEWYTDVNTKVLFLHCLLKANWKDGTWHGYNYKRGQFITSLPTLARETGLTVRQIRTALNHLKATGEVTDWHNNKVRIITVVSFDKFQKVDRQKGRQATGKRQTGDRQATADIRTYKNIEEDKEVKEAKTSSAGVPLPPEYQRMTDEELDDEVAGGVSLRDFIMLPKEEQDRLYKEDGWE